MCNDVSCICHSDDSTELEYLFCDIWELVFTPADEAELEYRETH